MTLVDIWGKKLPGGVNSECKGSEVASALHIQEIANVTE